jgi:hypothetical protein
VRGGGGRVSTVMVHMQHTHRKYLPTNEPPPPPNAEPVIPLLTNELAVRAETAVIADGRSCVVVSTVWV